MGYEFEIENYIYKKVSEKAWTIERFYWPIELFSQYITMAPKVDILQAFIKTAAVSGIGLVWVNFTVKAFKVAWHIMFTSPEEEDTWKAASRVMREDCKEYFVDDGNELEHGRFLCETCSD